MSVKFKGQVITITLFFNFQSYRYHLTFKTINETPNESLIDEIESEFWKDPDNLTDKLEEFALKNELIKTGNIN